MIKSDQSPHTQTTGRPYAACLSTLLITIAVAASQAPASDLANDPTTEPNEITDPDSTSLDQLESDEASGIADNFNDFASLSIEELMNIQVTSVAGVEQSWFQTPAAMYVITGEDLRRSGHLSIPEGLRLVPGVNVGRNNSNEWAISTRGLNNIFSNKLLVMIDGRIVFDPLFAGTLWNVQDIVLEDLAHIEVIRGPGATLWGANAVNGVININTKSAKDTQGLLMTSGGGDQEAGFGSVRYGGQLSDNTYYRIWGKYHNHEDYDTVTGDNQHDDWSMTRGGFRVDVEGEDDTVFTLDADAYNSGQIGGISTTAVPGHFTYETNIGNERASGGHVLARAKHTHSDGTGWSVQGYYDLTIRRRIGSGETRRDTFDLDARHSFRPDGSNEVVWGAGYRTTRDNTEDSPALFFEPETRTADTASFFVQDTFTVMPDTLFLMIGSKFEHNDYTGFEYQPSARFWWTPDDNQTVWAAVSRPVRTPARFESDVSLVTAYADPSLLMGGPPSGIFVPFLLTGNTDLDSEQLTAYELGYRVRALDNLSIDVAGFYNKYSDLLGPVLVPAGIAFDNLGSADTYGFDVTFNYNPTDRWTLKASYSLLRVQIKGGADDDNPLLDEHTSPRNTAKLISTVDIDDSLELNTAVYYVDNLSAVGAPSNIRLDVGLTWHMDEKFEVAVWGQNLLDDRTVEFSDSTSTDPPTEIERGFYIQATLRD